MAAGLDLPPMDLRSPQNAGAGGSTAQASPALGVAVGSPAHIALQQQQLSQLLAPPSPPPSPRSGPSGRRKLFRPPSAQDISNPFQLSIDSTSPTAAAADTLPKGTGSQQLNELPPTPATTTAAVFDSAFTFTPMPDSVAPAQLPAFYAQTPTAGAVPTVLSPSSGAGGPMSPSSVAVPGSSLRVPVFRHSTSQLLLRFLRQVMVHALLVRKDGWAIIDKVLDAFPSSIQHAGFGCMAQRMTPRQQPRAFTASEAGNSGGSSGSTINEEFARNEELIKSFQSAVLSILLVRLHEKVLASSAGTSFSLKSSRAAGKDLLFAQLVNPAAPGAPTHATSSIAATASGTQPGSVAQPSKFLVNVSRALELVLGKVQAGLFLSNNWNVLQLQPTLEAANPSAAMNAQTAGPGSVIQSITSAVQGALQPQRKASTGSTVGVMLLLASLLQHESLRPHIDTLNQFAADAVANAAAANSSNRRKSSTFVGGSNLAAALSVAAGGSVPTAATAAPNALSAGNATMSAAQASLQTAPTARCLRALVDVLLNCTLHLFEQHAVEQRCTDAELLALNAFLLAHKSVLLGDYALSSLHTSGYLSSDNTNFPSGQQQPQHASGGGQQHSMPTALHFNGRSFAACLLFHLYYFQLREPEPQPEPQPVAESTADATDASDGSGEPQVLPFLPPPSPPKQQQSIFSSLVPIADGELRSAELRHSALAILVWLVRTKGPLMAELMRAAITAGSGSTVVPASAGPSSLADDAASHTVRYDLFNKGFDALLHINMGAHLSAGLGAAAAASPLSAGARAEVDGFFAWLAIQRPILELVFARTLVPEWRSYASFLNALMLAAHEAALNKWRRSRARDKENDTIDLAELQQLHTAVEKMLAEAATLDSQRRWRRLQGALQSERALARKWIRLTQDDWRTLLFMYSTSRRIHTQVPSRKEGRTLAEQERSVRRALRREQKAGTSSSDSDSSTVENSSSLSSDSDSSDVGEALLPVGSFAPCQRWALDPVEGPSRMRARLVRSVLLPPDAPLFDFPYKREEDDVREAKRLQEIFAARRKAAEETRRAAASVPLQERGEGPDSADKPLNSAAAGKLLPPTEKIERNRSAAAATSCDYSGFASAVADTDLPPTGIGASAAPADAPAAATASSKDLSLLSDNGPVDTFDAELDTDAVRSRHRFGSDVGASAIGGGEAQDQVPNLTVTLYSTRGGTSSSVAFTPLSSAGSVSSSLLTPCSAGSTVGGGGLSIGSAVLLTPGGSSTMGKHVLESSDRPVLLRRAASLVTQSTPTSSKATTLNGNAGAVTGETRTLFNGDLKRQKSFFNGVGGSATNVLQISSPAAVAVAAHKHAHARTVSMGGLSPRSLPEESSGEASAATMATPASAPGEFTQLRPHSPDALYTPQSYRRSMSFSEEDNFAANAQAPDTLLTSPSSALSPSSVGLISPPPLLPPSHLSTEGSSAAAPGAVTVAVLDKLDITSPPGSSAARVTATMFSLPSPPVLQVDTPGGAHVRGNNATFQSPTGGDTSAAVGQAQPTAAVSTPAVSELISTVSMTPTPSAGGAAAVVNASHTELALDEQHHLSHAGVDDAADEDSLYLQYEERLRLLLEGDSISFHYNMLRLVGLDEVSGIVLLCSHSVFIVDHYQVNPRDGSIDRVDVSAEESAKIRAMQRAIAADGLGAAGEEDDSFDSGAGSWWRRCAYADIVAVHKRRYLLRPAALELFCADHSSHLLIVNINQRDQIYNNLMQLCPNLQAADGAGANAATAAATLLPAANNDADRLTSNSSLILGGRDSTASSSSSGSGGTTGGLILSSLSQGSGNASSSASVVPTAPPLLVSESSSSSSSMPLNAFGNRLISTFFFNHSLATDYAAGMISAAVASVLATFTTEWQHGLISNFDYLMILNSASGRSYSDLTQYPVMPWILADYDSPQLDLFNPASFRDLAKPMGALDERRAALHRNKYRETEALWRDEEREALAMARAAEGGTGDGSSGRSLSLMHGGGSGGVVPAGVSRAYHYATHYSSAAVVMYYLFRVAPFSQFLVQFQSGRFDRADRLWSSVKQAWLTASKLLSGDVKELIPELFYFPQMLSNGNKLDLGRRQDGRPVNDVLLPPWAHGSPREFVRLHRLALESDWVSAHLQEWIDLVFGHAQSGDAAVKAVNVFHYVTYAGAVDIEQIADPILRRGTIEQIKSFGQTPARLFAKPHPGKLVCSRPGQLFTAPRLLEATDMAAFPHPIGQIFQLDATVMLGGTAAATAVIDRHGYASAAERIFVLRPGQSLAVPALQPCSSFLPYSLHSPQVASSRNVRFNKSYRHSPACNKLSLLTWALSDGSLRAGVLDAGSLSGAGGLERASSVSLPASLNGVGGGPTLRAHRSYLNLHSWGLVRVAATPLEGDDGTLVTGGDDGLVCVWRRADFVSCVTASPGPHPESDYCLQGELHGHRAAVTCISVSRSFGLIATGSADGSVIIWDLARLRALRQLRWSPFGVRIAAVALSPSTGDVVFASANPTALFYADVNGALLARYPDPRVMNQQSAAAGGAAGAAFSSVPTQLLLDQKLDEITSLALAPGVGHREAPPESSGGSGSGTAAAAAAALPFSTDSAAVIVTGHKSGAVRIWNLRWLSFAELFRAVGALHHCSGFGRRRGSSAGEGRAGSGPGSRSHSPVRVGATAVTRASGQTSAPPVSGTAASDSVPSSVAPLGPPLTVNQGLPPVQLQVTLIDRTALPSAHLLRLPQSAQLAQPGLSDGALSTASELPASAAGMDELSVTSASTVSASVELISPELAPSSSPPLLPSQSPPAPAGADAAFLAASPTHTDLDDEVGAVNAAAAAAEATAIGEESAVSAPTSRVPTPVQAQVTAAAQSAAQNMSSQLFGSPGEEQLADEYFANGAQAEARARHALEHRASEIAPSLSTPPPGAVSPPPVASQWHLLTVAELLGHQVPVTALSLHRDGGSFYSGDATGHVLHFTVPGSDVGFPCGCKQSRNRARVKQHQLLALGGASSASAAAPRLMRMRCAHQHCAQICCEFCMLDHIRQQHPHPTAAGQDDNAHAAINSGAMR